MSLKLERSNPPEWLLGCECNNQVHYILLAQLFSNFHSAGDGEAGGRGWAGSVCAGVPAGG